MGWDVNVHVNLQKQLMMMMIMIMMMTLMKLVNSGTKFRPGIDKFCQPNSGCAQFQEVGRGYIYMCVCVSAHRRMYIYYKSRKLHTCHDFTFPYITRQFSTVQYIYNIVR
jgi:hypothetical protein